MDTQKSSHDTSLRGDRLEPVHSGRRAEVLRALRARHTLTVAQLASVVGVHPNTVRFHLRSLEHSGEVIRERSRRQVPGRPELHFRLAPAKASAPQRADLLAHILLGRISTAEDAHAEAAAAGRQWGRAEAQLSERQNSESVHGLVEMLEAAGFAPDQTETGCLDLYNCPLKEFLGAHGRLACSVHEGMMAGYLEGAHSTITVDALEPFATDSTCRAHLSPR